MQYIIFTLSVLIIAAFSLALYGLLSLNDFNLKKVWGRGWGTRLDVSLFVGVILVSIKNIITL